MPSHARGGSAAPYRSNSSSTCGKGFRGLDAPPAPARHVYLDGRWQHPTFARESRYSDFAPSTYDDDITIFSRILDYARSLLIQINGRFILRTTLSTCSIGRCSRGSPAQKDIEMIVSTPSPNLQSTARGSPSATYRSQSSRNGSCRFSSSASPRVFARNHPPAAQSSPTLVGASNKSSKYTASVASSQTTARSTADAATQYSPPNTSGTLTRTGTCASSEGRSSLMVEAGVDVPPPEPGLPPKRPGQAGATNTPPDSKTVVSIAAGPPISSSSSSVSSSSKSSVRSTAGPTCASVDGSSTSPTKRQRTLPRPLKVLPADYSRCPPQDLATIISSMLDELVRINDKIPLNSNNLTRFHSRAPPTISISDYLIRLTTHATLSPPILLSMVYYIDRLCTLYDAFTISSLTVHRFLITAATVASKGLSDSFWTNNTYARVGGVTMKELALLELEFLWRVEWKIVPKPEVLVDYYRSLVSRSEHFKLEGSSESSRSSSSGSESGRSRKSGSSSGRKKSKKSKGKEKEKIPETAEESMQTSGSQDDGSAKDIVMQENQ